MTTIRKDHKLLVTIVKRGKAKKIMKAAKSVGAEGGTILFGSGVGIHEKQKFFGIEAVHEKEIVLNLVPEDILPNLLDAISKEAKLNNKGKGIGFTIDIMKTIGIAHMAYEEVVKEEVVAMPDKHIKFDLIVTIVNKGDGGKVIEATKRGGAEGGTIINGRGSGIHETAKLLSIEIEPEKEIVLTLIKKTSTNNVIQTIQEDVKINEPGKGISFVLPVENTAGIHHLLNESEK